jgi:hypothetical protein
MKTEPVRVTAEANDTSSFEVVISPAVWIPKAAVSVTSPSAVISPLSVIISDAAERLQRHSSAVQTSSSGHGHRAAAG